MMVLGLTGSIGMGKSTVSKYVQQHSIPVWDADYCLNEEVYKSRSVLEQVEFALPGSVKDGMLDKTEVFRHIQSDPYVLEDLEDITFPYIQDRLFNFLAEWSLEPIVVLDVPLLFEGEFDQHTDLNIVVSCPAEMQRERVLRRPNMTEDKLNFILSRQWTDEEKRESADYIVDTSGTIADTEKQVEWTLNYIKERYIYQIGRAI
jgi:dephospho-CoA kinase